MGARRVVLGVVACAAAFGLLSGSSIAADVAAKTSAVYDVPEECPARSVWREQLQARLPASPATLAAIDALEVHIERSPGVARADSYRGHVGSESDAGGDRVVRGGSCRAVFDALILVAALGVDADAQARMGDERAGDERARDTRASDGRASDASEVIALPPGTERPAVPAPGDAGLVREPGADARRVRVGALGLALVQTGVAPNPSLDVGAGVTLGWGTAGLEPSLFLGVYTATATQAVRVDGAVARLEHWAVRALACPWRQPLREAVGLAPCVGVDTGRSRGEGSGASAAQTDSVQTLSLRAELRLDVSLLDSLRVGAAGGVALPLIRPRFYFEPGAVAFQVPPLGLEANAFAGLSF